MKNILMLDDDLIPLSRGMTAERSQLQPWLRWLKTGENGQKFNLIEAIDLTEMLRVMAEREFFQENDPKYIHGIIIDVMWKKTSYGKIDFSEIGFPDVPIIPNEAGAQLLKLLFGNNSQSSLPSALVAHKNRKMSVLSSIRGVEINLNGLPEALTILNKNTIEKLDANAGDPVMIPDMRFQNWIYSL